MDVAASERVQIALAEFEALQEIIARQDGFRAKTKALSTPLFAGLTFVFLTGTPELHWGGYLLCSLMIAVMFLLLEGVYGHTERNAQLRALEVERQLREPGAPNYTGPRICESLMVRLSWWTVIRTAKYARTSLVYLAMLAITAFALAFYSARPPKPSAPAAPAPTGVAAATAVPTRPSA